MVSDDDIILIVGDTSWALHLQDALPDLESIGAMKGRKFIIRGNHDYWWASAKKMTDAMGDAFTFLQGHGTAVDMGDYILALGGSRGYLCPNDVAFTPDTDQSIYARELLRMEAAFQEMEVAAKLLQEQADKTKPNDTITAPHNTKAKGEKPIIKVALFHYPPFNDKNEPSGFTELMEHYGIEHCVFGHLHDQVSFNRIPPIFGNIQLHLVSCDYLQFTMSEVNLQNSACSK